jgi:MerR HTH family regulatory protein
MAEIPTHWLHEETLGPREVSKIFDVDPRTISDWAKKGVIGFFRTPHGMRRFPVCEVKRLMAGDPAPDFLKEYADEDAQKYGEKWRGGWRRSVRIEEIDGAGE